MRKLFAIAVIIVATFSWGTAQQQNSASNSVADSQNMGIAPDRENGIGRADVRVVDQSGHPIQNAHVYLVSMRSDGFKCEGWGNTNTQGRLVIPPLHMGVVKIEVKAKKFHSQKVNIRNSDMSQPIVVTLVH